MTRLDSSLLHLLLVLRCWMFLKLMDGDGKPFRRAQLLLVILEIAYELVGLVRAMGI